MKSSLILCAFIAVGMLSACSQNTNEGPLESAGAALDTATKSASDSVGQALENAGGAIGETLDKVKTK